VEAAARQVLISGDLSAQEFEGLAAWLSIWPGLQLHAEEAAAWVANFDLVLLCAARPNRFSREEVEALRQRNPLATVIQIFGPWCAGEVRTGPVPDGVQRMAWYEWSYRLPDVIERGPVMPITSSPQEQALASLSELTVDGPSASVGIWADSASDFDYLRSACGALGHQAVWLQEDRLPKAHELDVLLGILSGTEGAEFDRLAHVCGAFPSISKLVCLGTPTWEDWQKVQRLGVTANLGQPFRLVDLAALLHPHADCGILPLVNRPSSR